MHSTIEISPNDALRPTNALWVSWHLWNSAKRDRTYEEIKEEYMFIIMVKQASLIKHITLIGQVTNIKLLELIIIIFFRPSY